jgi:hypothetical protein
VQPGPASTTEVESPSPLDFPAIAITGAAGEFADTYSKHFEVPRHFLFMSYLTCLGLLVADQLSLNSGLPTQPRLYTIILGESADDRKSTAIDKTADFFDDAATNLPVCRGVGSAEGLLKLLARSKRLLLCQDEFKQFAEKCKIKASALLPCVNTLFESNKYETRTKKDGPPLEGLYLSLLAASTIQTYESIWSSAATDIGFDNRLWLVPGSGERKFSIPGKVSDEEMEHLREELWKVVRFVKVHQELDLTSDARALFDDWYLDPKRKRTVFSKRLDTYALRLMPLLAANSLKPEVDVEVVRHVIAMVDHQHRIRELYSPISADNRGAKLEEKIRRALAKHGDMSKRDLFKAITAHRYGLFPVKLALDNLLINKEIAQRPGSRMFYLI